MDLTRRGRRFFYALETAERLFFERNEHTVIVKNLLFLAHRIPYPPNKGDKIRSFNWLQHLAKHYRVHLASFIDDPDDWRHVEKVRRMCATTCLVGLDPRRARMRSLTGLISGKALTLPYYHSKEIQAWVDNLLENNQIRYGVVFSSAMAQYLIGRMPDGMRSVIDFVDIDSDKWRQYAKSKGWPMNWIYRREGRKLLQTERQAAGAFDIGMFVSEAEADLFKTLAPEVEQCVTYVNNGVDTEYFSPERTYPNPYAADEKVIVFTGAMDYWANVDAVRWFAQDIFPMVQRRIPQAHFYIVGARPTSAVQQLGGASGVTVTGAVKDIRPYLAHAGVAVAPMRIARGIQNKVLEAMAMARAVVVSPEGLDGIHARVGEELLMAEGDARFASYVTEILTGAKYAEMGSAARARVVNDYSWQESLQRFEALLEGVPGVIHGHEKSGGSGIGGVPADLRQTERGQ